jgi:integrase
MSTGWKAWVGREPTAMDFLLPDGNGHPFREERADEFRALLASVSMPTSYNGIELTPYAIRHTFSTLLKRVGVAEDDRDYFMGHRPRSTPEEERDSNPGYVALRRFSKPLP